MFCRLINSVHEPRLLYFCRVHTKRYQHRKIMTKIYFKMIGHIEAFVPRDGFGEYVERLEQ